MDVERYDEPEVPSILRHIAFHVSLWSDFTDVSTIPLIRLPVCQSALGVKAARRKTLTLEKPYSRLSQLNEDALLLSSEYLDARSLKIPP